MNKNKSILNHYNCINLKKWYNFFDIQRIKGGCCEEECIAKDHFNTYLFFIALHIGHVFCLLGIPSFW